jgi:hypothetical protein
VEDEAAGCGVLVIVIGYGHIDFMMVASKSLYIAGRDGSDAADLPNYIQAV